MAEVFCHAMEQFSELRQNIPVADHETPGITDACLFQLCHHTRTSLSFNPQNTKTGLPGKGCQRDLVEIEEMKGNGI
jgi:hypothetical protein